ncbi:MAG: adenylate kinase [Candidatus Neomarinimicrobiota bacterium]
MIYLLGGAPRAGKSTIARKFLSETGIPFFDLDYLMMGLANGLPEYGVNPNDHELTVGEKLWPIVNSMVVAMIENKFDYLIEGAQIHPSHAWKLNNEFEGYLNISFIGFTNVDTTEKLHQIRSFRGRYNDWLKDLNDHDIVKTIERLKKLSIYLQKECGKYGLKYFDSSSDFEKTVNTVVDHLKDGLD